MLAGNQTAAFHSLLVQLHEIVVHPALEFILREIIAALIDVQVAVAGMTEALDHQAALLAALLGKGQEAGDFVNRNDNVALVQKLGLRLDGLQEAGTGRPGVLDPGRGIRHENIHGAFLQNQIAGLLHHVHEGILILAVQGDQKVGANLRAFHVLREHGAADVALAGENDLSFHELQGLQTKVRLFQLRHGADGAVQILERNDQADDALGRGDDLQGQLRDDA